MRGLHRRWYESAWVFQVSEARPWGALDTRLEQRC